ncbi:MAG TPA: acyl-CoA dehydrogenase family protein [Candidatus Dormibacteraeota bacterium]|jgi:alkylation response protein AidB-like acyl-CoA dehydrogenase|nr:acyl-CoA dehydrogenase family protein [Candidatus Dormibacteraeota bacterium]
MDFELSPEQAALRDTLRDFVRREIAPVARDWEHAGRYPEEIVEAMKGLGLFGMLVPAEYGGIDLDPISYAIVFEELSRGWMGVAGVLGSHSMATLLLARYGTEEQRQRWLPDLAAGRRRSGLALTEPGAGSDLQGIATVARRQGDEYVVRGTKTWITNARHADPLPVLVKTDPSAEPRHRGMSILMVERGTPGYEVSRDLGKLGYKGPESCEVVFAEARVPAANLLGGVEGRGLQQALSVLEFGRINVAARSVGIAQAAYDQALAYARQRHAFGRPIAEFQAVQLKLADLATEVQAARLLTWWAASRAGRERADVETGMAKYFASEVALRSSLTAMRVHGGYGYSTEFEVERLYRDAPLMAIGEGTNDILRTVIARGLLAEAGD